jgi:hypothetical protein
VLVRHRDDRRERNVKKVIVTVIIVLAAGWIALFLASRAQVPYCDIQIVKAELGPNHQFQYAIAESSVGTIYITRWEEGPNAPLCSGGNGGGSSGMLGSIPFFASPGSMSGAFNVPDGFTTVIKQVNNGEKFRLTAGATLTLLECADSKGERRRLFLKAVGSNAEFDQAVNNAENAQSPDKK